MSAVIASTVDPFKVKSAQPDLVIPPDLQPLGSEDLYLCPFSMIHPGLLPENLDQLVGSNTSLPYFNPRLLGSTGDKPPEGFTREDLEALADDIAEKGLIYALICRWVIQDGTLGVQVVEGHRRYICIDQLLREDRLVYSTAEDRKLPASQVFARVLSKISVHDDDDAVALAFMAQERHIPWGDGAVARQFRYWRQARYTDERILHITKRSGQWVREMDLINSLDELSFSYLVQGKINRTVALDLARKFENVELRQKYLLAAYQDAEEHHPEVLAKAQVEEDRAVERETLAEAALNCAVEVGGNVEEAQAKLQEAHTRTQQKRRARQNVEKPQAKTKNFRRAAAKIAAEAENDDESQPGALPPLRPGKIKEQLEVIQKLIDQGGMKEDGKVIWTVNDLHLLAAWGRAIRDGEEDIEKVLRRHHKAMRLHNMRKPPPVPAEPEPEPAEAASE